MARALYLAEKVDRLMKMRIIGSEKMKKLPDGNFAAEGAEVFSWVAKSKKDGGRENVCVFGRNRSAAI